MTSSLHQLLLLFMFLVESAKGSGVIWMRLVSFVNPGGKGDNGHYCDGKFFIKGSPCDHRFMICMDHSGGNDNIYSCKYGRRDTGEAGEFNSRTFGSRVGRMANPTTFAFSSWPGAVKIKIKIIDVDDNDDDYVDYIKGVFRSRAYRGSSAASTTRVLIKRRTRMSVDLKVYCNSNYYGPTCTQFCVPRDDTYGHYTCDQTTGERVCMEGWKGDYCHISIDNCYNEPCANGGVCHNLLSGYSCDCQDGYAGTRCYTNIDECESNPCTNGGLCFDQVAGFNCKCPPGWTGTTCAEDADECSTLNTPCFNNGSCVNTPGSYVCVCPAGWTGDRCKEDINECLSQHPCHMQADCLNTEGSFQCVCPKGLAGTLCLDDVNECEQSPCFGNSSCINVHGTYRCLCPSGWTGRLCNEDVNECEDQICQNSATCENMNGTFHCHCPKGRTGTFCEEDINECMSMPCQHHSTCVNYDGSFRCECQHGYTGRLCETDIDECTSDPCQHFGVCSDQIDGFTCTCARGWSGFMCETEVDECKGRRDPVRLTVKGHLNQSLEEDLRDSIRDAIHEELNENLQILRVLLSPQYQTRDNISVVTTVDIAVYAGGIQICEDEVLFVLNKNNRYKSMIPWPSYLGPARLVSDDNNNIPSAEDDEHSWLVTHWYIVLIIAGILCIAVVVFAIIHRKKAKAKLKIVHHIASRTPCSNGPDSGTLRIPDDDIGSDIGGTASLSFDNVLYTTFQPQETSKLMGLGTGKSSSSDEGVCSSSSCAGESLYSEADDCCATKLKYTDDGFYSEVR